jgi:sirohydrochlorin ferrochelatase
MNTIGRWTIALAIALLMGATYVQYMVSEPLRMNIYLTGSLALLFALIVMLARWFSGTRRFIAVAAFCAAFAAGWYIMTAVVFDREDYRPIPELTREKSDPGAGHTAVVYLTHGEPPLYDPISWINQMNEFEEQDIPFLPYMARPFFLKSLRDHYLAVGKSSHRDESMAMMLSLELAYRLEGDLGTKFYMGFLDDNPRVPAAVINALNDGASRIIVAEVFVTTSSHTEEGEHQVNEVDPESFGVETKFTAPIWDSVPVYRMIVDRSNHLRGETDKARTGILLVAHGQPDEWDEIWPLQTEQEELFGDRILDALEADGYPSGNLAKAWMSFKNPKPAPVVEQMLTNGIDKLLFMSYTISAPGMHALYDIPALVYKAEAPENFPIVNMGALGNDPQFITVLKERIDAAMADEQFVAGQ